MSTWTLLTCSYLRRRFQTRLCCLPLPQTPSRHPRRKYSYRQKRTTVTFSRRTITPRLSRRRARPTELRTSANPGPRFSRIRRTRPRLIFRYRTLAKRNTLHRVRRNYYYYYYYYSLHQIHLSPKMKTTPHPNRQYSSPSLDLHSTRKFSHLSRR